VSKEENGRGLVAAISQMEKESFLRMSRRESVEGKKTLGEKEDRKRMLSSGGNECCGRRSAQNKKKEIFPEKGWGAEGVSSQGGKLWKQGGKDRRERFQLHFVEKDAKTAHTQKKKAPKVPPKERKRMLVLRQTENLSFCFQKKKRDYFNFLSGGRGGGMIQ